MLQERENRIKEELKQKELIKYLKQKQSELEELKRKENKRREKERRINTLLEKERELQESLSEKTERLSILDDEIEHDIEKHYPRKQPIPAMIHKPNVPKLSEGQFEEWKMEVEFMVDSGLYNEEILKQAVRNSLTGNMRRILLTIKKEASIQEIINKLEGIYGNVRSGESIIEEFYSSKQRKGESISAWGLRLENLVQVAIEKGHIQENQRDDMLKSRFWRYLEDEDLKNATRLTFETCSSFEELRLKTRREEQEMKKTEEISHIKSAQQTKQTRDNDTLLKELLEKINRIESKLNRLEREKTEQNGQYRYQDRGRQTYRSNINRRGRGNYNDFRQRNCYRQRYTERTLNDDKTETELRKLTPRAEKETNKVGHLN